MPAKFTNKEKAEAVERELKYRRYVYPRRVSDGRMTQAAADKQIALFEDIYEDYRTTAAAEEMAGRLL